MEDGEGEGEEAMLAMRLGEAALGKTSGDEERENQL